jgi:choline dehydrogenase-like flavoprotein
VCGIDGLRVVAASVMPVIPRGNTHAPTTRITERAADLIRAAREPSTVVATGGRARGPPLTGRHPATTSHPTMPAL